MAIIVQKYGGTSVGSVERMRHVADLIMAERSAGNQVVVVVSAMAGITNQLVKSAQQFSNAIGTTAYDFVISTGENVSCGMLALALAEKGVLAEPLAGWQVPIRTNGTHSRARVLDIDSNHISQLLNKGIVPIIAGFQGVDPDRHITTLGRGGSDTSAVEISAALKAGRCDIYTDIDGIYTADPRVVSSAQFIPRISYDLAYWMAALGAKIIHPRAVERGMRSKVPLRILSSFGSDKFTLLADIQTVPNVIGIAHNQDSLMVNVPIKLQHVGSKILDEVRGQDMPVDMVKLSATHLNFCCDAADNGMINKIFASNDVSGTVRLCAKMSVVGGAAKQHLFDITKILENSDVSSMCIHADDSRVSVCVDVSYMERVINALHAFFFKPTSKKIDFQPEMQ